MTRPDVIVIGAGHNGLVTANYLADAGMRVCVLERRPVVGGATVTEELIPGFRASSCAYVLALLHRKVVADLELERFGLERYQTDVQNVNLLQDGRSMVLWRDLSRTLRDLDAAHPGEAERFVALGARIERFAELTGPWLLDEPPSRAEVAALFEEAGEAELYAQFFTSSIGDLLGRYLEYDLLKGLLTFFALVSVWGGPWTPGWSCLYGHHSTGEYNGHMGQFAFPRGGMGAVSAALAKRAAARGVEIRTEAPVNRVLVEGGRARGVRLASGEELAAGLVVSNADPHRTFLQMFDEGDLPDDFRGGIAALDMRGSMARVHIALDGLPDFVGMESGPGPQYRGLTLIGAEVDRFETAWQSQQRGEIPEDFPIEFICPSVHDDSLAPPGKHILMTGIQQLPFELADGTWDDHKAAFTERVLDVMTRYAPNLRDHVIDTHTITPLDLEREYGLTGGNIFHGAITVDHVFGSRPAPGWGGYRTPVEGMYLCGSGAHPGGGVMGVPGHNAAQTMLRDLAGGDGAPTASSRRGPRGPAVMTRLAARPRARKLMVKLAQRPALAPVVERLSRRRSDD